jgi:hypothetical protein
MRGPGSTDRGTLTVGEISDTNEVDHSIDTDEIESQFCSFTKFGELYARRLDDLIPSVSADVP